VNDLVHPGKDGPQPDQGVLSDCLISTPAHQLLFIGHLSTKVTYL
jgi:hypothetical protein